MSITFLDEWEAIPISNFLSNTLEIVLQWNFRYFPFDAYGWFAILDVYDGWLIPTKITPYRYVNKKKLILFVFFFLSHLISEHRVEYFIFGVNDIFARQQWVWPSHGFQFESRAHLQQQNAKYAK